MALTVGARLGPYEVTSALGRGGMGEVFRARDMRLNRDVALKVLPDLFASDPERLARFAREAQILASLNHPNIAQIYGVEDMTGTPALVMELVEGPTLAELIDARAHGSGSRASGPARSRAPVAGHGGAGTVAEALEIARQIADALEAAHEQGIIHRDLKPQNVKVRPDGTVKVLDFGLAKALEPAGTRDAPADSPTITSHGTCVGTLLGTAAYMAPEQVKGRPADRRADVWAFGVVLYELLTAAGRSGGHHVRDRRARHRTRARLVEAAGRPAAVRAAPAPPLSREGSEAAALEAAAAPDAGRQALPLQDVAASRRIPGWMLGGGLVLALAAGVGIGRWLLVPAQTTPTSVRFRGQPADRRARGHGA
jgi:eukaryotic-like serine/threonine-protein kinase